MTDGTSPQEQSVAYAGCTESGFDLIRYVHSELVPISEIVTLTPEQGDEHSVAGYYDHSEFARTEDITVHTPKTYSMEEKSDLEHFEALDADVLIVHGWQRLIPEAILETFTHGAFGLHGSAFGLPKGRGRSPMNWSLIEDFDRFLLSVIQLDAGVDSGSVVDTKKFDILAHDDIRTMYYKLVLAAQEMYERSIDDILTGTFDVEDQDEEPTYYPKRTPDDGEINWKDPTRVVYNLIRAVSRPYPGATTKHNETRIEVYDAQPFSADFAFDAKPGTIVQVYTPTEDFIVKTSDGTLLVTDWETSEWEPASEMVLSSLENKSIDSPNRVDRQNHEHSLSTQ